MITRIKKCPRCGCDIVQEVKTTDELLQEIEHETESWANDMREDLSSVSNKSEPNYDYADLDPITCKNCGNFESVEDIDLYWKENKEPVLKSFMGGEKHYMKICDFCNGKNVVTTIAIYPFKIGEKELGYKWLKNATEYDVCDKCLEKLENTIVNECEVKHD